MQQEPKQSYEFGPFHLDPVKRVLLKDGKQVPLTPKAFDVLLLLVENQGQAVAKGEIMDHVWAHSFVEESNLTVHISTLRKTLGENRGYIQTIPNRGYRFVADVRALLVDEKWVAYVDSQDGQFDIWIMPLAGDVARRITHEPTMTCTQPGILTGRESFIALTAARHTSSS
jgi:DNA-binding winged helix-turn-helix (wHTH) protein